MASPSSVRTSLSVQVVSSSSLFNGTFTKTLHAMNTTTLIFNSSSLLPTTIPTTSSLTSPLRTTSTAMTSSHVALFPNARVGPMPPIFSPDSDSPIRTVKPSTSSSHTESGDTVLFPSGGNNGGENSEPAPFYDASSSERVIIVAVLFAAMMVIGIVVVGAVVVNGRRHRRQQKLKVERLIARAHHPRSPSDSWNRPDVAPPLREISPSFVYGATPNISDTLDSDSSGSNPRLNISHPDDPLYFSVPPRDIPLPHDPTILLDKRHSRSHRSSLLPYDQVEDEIWEANKRRSNRSSFMALLKPRSSAQDLHPNAHRYAHDSDASLTSLNILLQHAEQRAAITQRSPSPANINSRPSYTSMRSELANRNSSSSFQNRPPSSHSAENVFIGRNRRIKSKGSFGSHEDQVDLFVPLQQRQSIPDLSPDGANSSTSTAHLGFSPVTPAMYSYIPPAPSSPVVPTKAPAGVYLLPTNAAHDPSAQLVLPGTYMYYIVRQADVIHENTNAEQPILNNDVVDLSSTQTPQGQMPASPTIALFEATDEEVDADFVG
ncbi:hypothetical protein BJ742DRAFT_835283 [Cladochytrium replicatum]|nr:hypothetical protein BJ742DRAFT_835283 [Cladochytrium replicatum]